MKKHYLYFKLVTMKKINLLTLLFLIIITACNVQKKVQKPVVSVSVPYTLETLEADLAQLDGVEVEKLQKAGPDFKIAFKLMIEQPLDHSDPSKGTFTQKVYLSHDDPGAPMVMNINGYSVPANSFTSELVPWLDANQMHVEHRFFGESMPDELNYEYLTIEQAANDHHRIIELLKEVYTGKWITTGISKGGQATIFHSTFFPKDVDMSIPYVAPVNKTVEDERLITFLDNVGSAECRATILEYQRSILEDYDESFALFKNVVEKRKMAFPMKLEKAFELSILEYEFAYWQWSGGSNCDQIPGGEAETQVLVDQLFAIDTPGFFTSSGIEYFFPFFYQAYAELGMYGYAVDSLDGYLREYTEYVNNYNTFIPADMIIEFDPSVLNRVHDYLENDADNFLYIYGENDAWSATAFTPNPKKTNSVALFKKDGSHFTRIKDLSEAQQKIAFDKIEKWLDVKLIRS